MPNQLWVSDFTYVLSWKGMVYVADVLRPQDCWLASLNLYDNQLRARCPELSNLPAMLR